MFFLSAAWCLVLAVTLASFLQTLRSSPRVFFQGIFLFAFAMVLRSYFATNGPGDLHISAMATAYYGPGMEALLRLFPGGTLADGILRTNLWLSAFAPCLLFVALRRESGDDGLAFSAAFILAMQPLLVRHGGEMNRQPAVLLAGISVLLFLASARRTSGWKATMSAALAGLAAIVAVGCRPEAIMVLPLSLLYVLLVPYDGAAPWRRRARDGTCQWV